MTIVESEKPSHGRNLRSRHSIPRGEMENSILPRSFLRKPLKFTDANIRLLVGASADNEASAEALREDSSVAEVWGLATATMVIIRSAINSKKAVQKWTALYFVILNFVR